MKSIILCGGGTAGHVLPALALIPELKKHYQKIIYIGSFNGIEQKLAQKYDLKFYGVNCAKFKRSLSTQNLLIPYRLIKGINQAVKLLKEIKPSVVFSKGGYVALPVVIASYRLKIPVIAHESDLSPGLSNKISSKFCKCVCTSFLQCAEKFKNGVYTGSPIRKELFTGSKDNFFRNYGTFDNKPILLFTGGSSGAKFLNQLLRSCLDDLLKSFNIIHITGKGNLISNGQKGYIQIEFTEKISDIFAVSDYVISRAGSNTLFELLCLEKPVLLVPLPKGTSRGDQVENAKYFLEKKCVLTVNQADLNQKTLIENINLLKKEKNNLIANIKRNNFKDGNENILNCILKYSL